MTAVGVNIDALVASLRRYVDRPLVDSTGVAGRYDFTLRFRPERGLPGGLVIPERPDSSPILFTALQDQLGLTLQPAQGPVEQLVIRSIQRPTGD